MKNYIRPELEIELFSDEAIMTSTPVEAYSSMQEKNGVKSDNITVVTESLNFVL